jgi:hypothetical protein
MSSHHEFNRFTWSEETGSRYLFDWDKHYDPSILGVEGADSWGLERKSRRVATDGDVMSG